MKKGRWKIDFEIGLGIAVVFLVASVGFAAAAATNVKSKPKFKNSLPKAAPRTAVTPAKKVAPKPAPKAMPASVPQGIINTAPATVKKESPKSSGIPVLTAPAPTPESGFSSDY